MSNPENHVGLDYVQKPKALPNPTLNSGLRLASRLFNWLANTVHCEQAFLNYGPKVLVAAS